MSFTDLLDEHGIRYFTGNVPEAKGKARRGWVNFRCPFCGKEPYFGYNVARKYGNCWSCGRLDLIETLMALFSWPREAAQRIARDLPRQEGYFEKVRKCGTFQKPETFPLLQQQWHCEYLTGRHFTPAAIERLWGVEALCGKVLDEPWSRILRWRLWVPYYFQGQQVSWTTRSINGKEPRYYAARDEQSTLSVRDLLYGIDYVRNAVIIVEGPVDAWAIGPGGVAIGGLRTSPAQLEQLSRIPLRIVCFDAEEAAQRRAKRLLADLAPFEGKSYRVVLETAKDAAAADRREVRELRRLAFGEEKQGGLRSLSSPQAPQ